MSTASQAQPDDDAPSSAAWSVVRGWLVDDPMGRDVLDQLVKDPVQGAEALRDRLENAALPGLGAAVTGGMLGKLVQVASAQAVHVHHDSTAQQRAHAPAELPNPLTGFTGRKSHLDSILSMCAERRGIESPAIAVIVGQAGVGKSALIVQAANELAGHYPDGQLYVNLQGSTPGVTPPDGSEVLGRFLRALGMDGKDIPVHAEEAAARFRSLTANRRLLVVLDNAGSIRQVRHLVPSGRGAAVLITTRTPLNSLDGAIHYPLDVLSHAESVALLEHFIGEERIAAETAQAERIVRLCARLPLALRIASARLAARPSWPLQHLARKLSNETQRLNELRVGDLAIRASFEVSYAALRSESEDDCSELPPTRMFHLFGLVEGAEMSGRAAAAMAGVDEYDAEDALERLVDAQLVETATPGRYKMHDLIRLLAVEHAAKDADLDAQQASLDRLFEFYRSTAQQASRYLQAADPRRSSGAEALDVAIQDRTEAMAWFEAERTNLVSAARQAAKGDASLAHYAVEIADAVFWFCHQRMYARDLETVNGEALKAAQRLDDRAGQSQALHNLSIACLRLHEFDRAVRHGNEALILRRELEDQYGVSRTLDALGRASFALGDSRQAVAYGEEALRAAREIQDGYSESAVLCNLVPVYLALQRAEDAIYAAQKSLDIRTDLDDTYGEARMRVSLGIAYKAGGRLSEAIECFSISKKVFTQIGDRYNEGRTLLLLAETNLAEDRPDEALKYALACVAMRRETGDRFGEAETLKLLGRIHLCQARPDQARQCLEAAVSILSEINPKKAESAQRMLDESRRHIE